MGQKEEEGGATTSTKIKTTIAERVWTNQTHISVGIPITATATAMTTTVIIAYIRIMATMATTN